jgi:hypothetical protein
MLKRTVLILSMAACGAASPLLAQTAPSNAGPSLYVSYANGPWKNPNFFPIAVWWQAPVPDAATVAAENINIFYTISGRTATGKWPEQFGVDLGELEAIKSNNLYLIGGSNTPYLQNTSVDSVASVLALTNAIGAQSNLIGYEAGDEPSCTPGTPVANGYNYPPSMAQAPTVVADLHSYDPTRIVMYNQTGWMTAPQFQGCLDLAIPALQAASVASMDNFVMTSPYGKYPLDFAKSDFYSLPDDKVWMMGLTTDSLVHFAAPNQPVWTFIGSGGDDYGLSEANNVFAGGVTSGSEVLVNRSGWSVFTTTWIGLTVSGTGIPADTKIVSVQSPTRAVLSAAATATEASENISVTGGARNSDCVSRVNLCVVNGNEYRTMPVEVQAEVWSAIINGSNGIVWFCHDLVALNFCLGPHAAGGAGQASALNVKYIGAILLSFAPELNAPTVGRCSMQHLNYATGARSITAACSDGILQISTVDISVPGMGLVKQYNGKTYLFAQSDRRSKNGTVLRFTLQGLAGKPLKIVYDSNSHYDTPHRVPTSAVNLDAHGAFSDTFGANGDDYQVKIYQIG